MTNTSNLITLSNVKLNSYFLLTKGTRNHYFIQGIYMKKKIKINQILIKIYYKKHSAESLSNSKRVFIFLMHVGPSPSLGLADENPEYLAHTLHILFTKFKLSITDCIITRVRYIKRQYFYNI